MRAGCFVGRLQDVVGISGAAAPRAISHAIRFVRAPGAPVSAIVLSGGRIVGSGGALVATGSSQPAFPLIASMAQGGAQSYGQDSTSGFVSYTASAPTTPAGIGVQSLGSPDLIVIGGSFRGRGAISGPNQQKLLTGGQGG